ncbi:MAG: hypothetical protein ABFS39_19390 [Pseudomonadota bacterium]
MTTFDEFCAHYALDADDPDAQLQYEQYKAAYELLIQAVGT